MLRDKENWRMEKIHGRDIMPSADFFTESIVNGVPVHLVRSPDLWIEGTGLDQLRAVAGLDGVVEVIGLPDLQPGRGYPIGSVALTRNRLIPVLIDKDIGCGMFFASFGETRINPAKIAKKLSGRFFSWDGISVSPSGFRDLLEHPTRWPCFLQEAFPDCTTVSTQSDKKAYGVKDMDSGATADLVSDESLESSARIMGTIGTGNHFIEIQKVAELKDAGLAERFGIQERTSCITIHTGSRSFGYALAERIFWEAKDTGKSLPPDSSLWRRYLTIMQVAMNFAALNRLILLLRILDVIKPAFVRIILDKPHNSAEVISLDSESVQVLHRKGAAPAHFNAESPDPVIIPGSMGNESWFCVAGENVPKALNSVNHGVGRKWMRSVAAEKLRRKAQEKGMRAVTGKAEVVCNDPNHLFEEGGASYKDVESVMVCAEGAGLIRRVARLEPILTVRE